MAQCPTNIEIEQELKSIEANNSSTFAQKLRSYYELKKSAENCNATNDSTIAWILLKIGKYEFFANSNYNLAIQHTVKAFQVNNHTSGNATSMRIAINAYYNLGYYYRSLKYYKKSLAYYDTAILLCKGFVDTEQFELDARTNKADIYFLTGDYQQAVEESIRGMVTSASERDTFRYVFFLNRKAQSLCFENLLMQASIDAASAATLSGNIGYKLEQATAFKTLALTYEKQKKMQEANAFFRKAVETRKIGKDPQLIASDYNDWGNFFSLSKTDYKNAAACYQQTLFYADKITDPTDRSLKIALANVNLAVNSYIQNKLSESAGFYMKVFKSLNLDVQDNFNLNPSASSLGLVINKDLVFELMHGKTLVHLRRYTINKYAADLDACLRAALVTDSIITQIRHEHESELSKLFWRSKTREFYALALQAAYEKRDAPLAFYFMEKSQAVLLNDKLNELSAMAHLPPTESSEEERLQLNIVEAQQKLGEFSDTSDAYRAQQNKLLLAKDEWRRFMKSLEQKFPQYYQYKYADDVPSLTDLQQYLAKNHQAFVHYFTSDTATYVLAVSGSDTKFIRLSKDQFNSDQLVAFLQLCADRQALNNHYNNYAALSYSIYKQLFQPLQIPKGRVIICADNFLVPFEALSSGPDGKDFLLNDYVFSYVYSARYMLNKFNDHIAKGDFLGIAPVSFATYLKLPALDASGKAIQRAGSFYSSTKLLSNGNANSKNFLHQLPNYTIVNIFSHASADSSQREPYLCMADSIIYLSQLQLINNPATKLVVLSACETNAGQHATGEGIYSLARGFALAGIPSVSATLWKADERTIYAITELFNRNLAQGMNKDEALQQAKLSFLKNNSGENQLPYYWANMILVGNATSLDLSSTTHIWWWLGGIVSFLTIFFLILYRSRKTARR